jgi:uroporphyrinogen-III synthase
MPPLTGRRIALLESRKSEELSELVRRLGGTAISAPSVREVPRHDDAATFIEATTTRRADVAIFLTGVGATALLDDANRRGQLAAVLDGLRQITVACRGPKPLGVMRRVGITPAIVTAKPHTTHELLDALASIDLGGKRVLVAHYGERSTDLTTALRERGASIVDVCPYEWALPEDVTPLTNLVRETIAGHVDAMLFTSQVQCRHLFAIAAQLDSAASLAAALNQDVVVGAVGPVCAQAIRDAGVTPDVIPESPNMASLIAAVADYFELTHPT